MVSAMFRARARSFCVALKSNGTVVAWGGNYQGQTNVPPELTNVVAVSAGAAHALALRRDGTVVGWGWNNYGQTNVPVGLSNVVAIAASRAYNIALRSDGTLAAWGDPGYGQTTVPSGLSNIVAISAAQDYCTAITFDLKTIWIEGGAEGPRIRFHTFAGQQYAVEYSADPSVGNWISLLGGIVQGTGEDAAVTDGNGGGAVARFYRVRRSW